MRRSIVCACAVIVSVMGAGPVLADDGPAPDKSGYTLFNPVPSDQLRSFCTDRPTKSNLPCTVDAGHFQYEADLFNYTTFDRNGAKQQILLFTNPTLKVGLTNRVDLEVNIAPLERVTTSAGGARTSLDGVGDLFIRSKVNLFGPEGGDFQATLLPFLKVPTARAGIGNGAFEGGLIVPVSFGLPTDFTLLFDPEIDVLKNAVDNDRHANFQFLANLSHAIGKSVTGSIELWGDANKDPSKTTFQSSLDLALSWIPSGRPNLQFDAGANIGLTSATPQLQAYLGVSQRF